MLRFIINRLLQMIIVVFGVMLFVFIISRATGDPIPSLLGSNYTQAQYDELYVEMGFDQPYIVQFFYYIRDVILYQDLGISYESKRPVIEEVLTRFPVSMRLAIYSIVIFVPIGIAIGIISAVKQYSALDYTITTFALILAAMPGFWAGLMLMLIFSLQLGWLPATGIDSWKGWILPCVTQGLSPIAYNARMSRSTMLEVIRQDYIRTARSKGLSEFKVIMGHALPNTLLPVVTTVGTLFSILVGGGAIVENIFGIPGLGSYMIFSIQAKDFPSVQGSVLLFSLFVCVVNVIVDILYGFIDPRVKAMYMGTGKKPKAQPQEEGSAA